MIPMYVRSKLISGQFPSLTTPGESQLDTYGNARTEGQIRTQNCDGAHVNCDIYTPNCVPKYDCGTDGIRYWGGW